MNEEVKEDGFTGVDITVNPLKGQRKRFSEKRLKNKTIWTVILYSTGLSNLLNVEAEKNPDALLIIL